MLTIFVGHGHVGWNDKQGWKAVYPAHLRCMSLIDAIQHIDAKNRRAYSQLQKKNSELVLRS